MTEIRSKTNKEKDSLVSPQIARGGKEKEKNCISFREIEEQNMKVYLIHDHSNGLRRKAMFKMASHAYIDFGKYLVISILKRRRCERLAPISPTSNKNGVELLSGESKPSGIMHMVFL